MRYIDRVPLIQNSTGQKLLTLMEEKQSNLCVAIDATQSEELLQYVRQIASSICVLKTHIDILNDFSGDVIDELITLQNEYHFLIFEDRKFADIGHTVQLQYSQGPFKIVDWADIINAHVLPGPGIIQALRDVGLSKGRGLLLLADMTSIGNLVDDTYRHAAHDMASEYKNFVFGFIGSGMNAIDPRWIVMTPGIHRGEKGDVLGQQYQLPEDAIARSTDIIIVGRGVTHASDPAQAAMEYQTVGWKAYQTREEI